ncbi:biotin synthase BioB [Rhodocyclus tenuis]|uniref:biotin synthase BioB n=1 Tax=Rhodocyclus tenuis TaxID=1066 RepID=UPI0019035BDB|nr:biotin synthase BioB [Rhodocyclus tenuis]MBK1681200.1 biotin synthase BioB [Rhodocyclus tenuis]
MNDHTPAAVLAAEAGSSALAATASAPLTTAEIEALYELPLMDLLYRAASVHRANFDANEVQRSALLSVKTGGCGENCGYCSQSAHHEGETPRESLLSVDQVVAAATAAKEQGASRFCMGAAWRGPKDSDLVKVAEMVSAVKALGLETCVTLGMLKDGQAEALKEAGLDYYNHNLDTSAEHYTNIVTTHKQTDRVETLGRVRGAGLKVCSGGIVGMGEARRDRAALIAQLAAMEPPPESVPINHLTPIPGTPLENAPPLDPFEFVRTIAAARIAMPKSFVRLSAGRQNMSEELQAMCFFAGANSIFYGENLLTTENADAERDQALFAKLQLRAI